MNGVLQLSSSPYMFALPMLLPTFTAFTSVLRPVAEILDKETSFLELVFLRKPLLLYGTITAWFLLVSETDVGESFSKMTYSTERNRTLPQFHLLSKLHAEVTHSNGLFSWF